MKTVSRSVLVWCCFLVLAFVNGAFRELVMVKVLGVDPGSANQVSCLTGVALWTALLLCVWRRLEVEKVIHAALIGMGWLVATLLFETLIIDHQLTWSQVLHTYDVSAGEYWGLVVIWIGVMPLGALAFDNFRKWINH